MVEHSSTLFELLLRYYDLLSYVEEDVGAVDKKAHKEKRKMFK